MSRIGKVPVPLPGGVTASIEGSVLSIRGPKGTLSMPMLDDISYGIEDERIVVKPANETKRARSFWGMHRTLVQNLVTGVGYRAAAQGKNLRLQLGYSHDVNIEVPEGLTVATPDPTTVVISGNDKQRVGQLAAEIRRWRKPEPYKGKGIKYRGEYIFRKEGKKK